MDLVIKKIGINGEGIGYDNRIPVFVPGALVGETIECVVTENKQRYKVAQLIKVKQKSKERIFAPCACQRDCGGCPLMILSYPEQLKVKMELLKEALKKYADGYADRIDEIIPSKEVFHYRNQCKLPMKQVKGELKSGLYASGSNFLYGLDQCVVHEKILDEARLKITAILQERGYRDYNESIKHGIRTLVVRHFSGKIQATIVSGQDEIDQVTIDRIMEIPGMTSLYQNINNSRKTVPVFSEIFKHLAGSKSLVIEENGLKLKLSPASFFQLNTNQAFTLYNNVAQLIPSCDLLVEAYCGIGTMSLLLANQVKEVVGIEIIGSAIKNANENARLNHIENAQFITGDAAAETTKISKKRKIDVLLIDPPRSGIDDAMMDCIMRSKIKTIVYVSCNPATLAKNLSELTHMYEVERITPVDMFPNTPLVESIVVLKRR